MHSYRLLIVGVGRQRDPAHSLHLLEAVQVGSLEEEAAADGQVVPAEIVRDERAGLRHLFFVERPVTGMEHGTRNELIRRQKISQEAMGRAVELLEEAHQEVLVKLVGGFGVNDVNAEYSLARRGTGESHRADVEALIEVLVGLKRHATAGASRFSLEGLHQIVINRAP